MTQNAIFGKIRKLQKIIKSNLGVEYTFPGRFWKAEGPYFSKIKIASTNLSIFMPFWNHNGIILPRGGFQPENACMSFGLQKGSNLKSELGNEKYGPWAFQNRPGNIAATSKFRTIFRTS